MSWWVMEQVSVNEAGTQTLANIQCDNVSDLPTPDQSTTLGYIIIRGSQAKVLATSENYILGSTGTWVKMKDGVKLDLTGYATEQYVDDGLADKVDTSVYSSGQAAQDTVIAGKADVSKFDITLSAQITASEYSYSCIKTGDIVTVCFRIVLASSLNANTSYSLFQLPSNTYPRITVAGTGYADSKVCTFWLNTSGQIRFTVGADAIPSGASINANFCFSYKAANWTTVTI